MPSWCTFPTDIFRIEPPLHLLLTKGQPKPRDSSTWPLVFPWICKWSYATGPLDWRNQLSREAILSGDSGSLPRDSDCSFGDDQKKNSKGKKKNQWPHGNSFFTSSSFPFSLIARSSTNRPNPFCKSFTSFALSLISFLPPFFHPNFTFTFDGYSEDLDEEIRIMKERLNELKRQQAKLRNQGSEVQKLSAMKTVLKPKDLVPFWDVHYQGRL